MTVLAVLLVFLAGLLAGMFLMFAILDWQSSHGGWIGNDGYRYKIERHD